MIFCSIRYCRNLGSDHWLMPISAIGEERATSAICSRRSAVKTRAERVWNQGYQVMPSMPAFFWRPTENMTILALRLLTALRLCRIRRRNLVFSNGRSGRTLTLSFMVHLQVESNRDPRLEVSYARAAQQLLGRLPIRTHRPPSRKLSAENGTSERRDRGHSVEWQ